MKYCTKCCELLPEDALFCSRCGKTQQAEPNKISGVRKVAILKVTFSLIIAVLMIASFFLPIVRVNHRSLTVDNVNGGSFAVSPLDIITLTADSFGDETKVSGTSAYRTYAILEAQHNGIRAENGYTCYDCGSTLHGKLQYSFLRAQLQSALYGPNPLLILAAVLSVAYLAAGITCAVFFVLALTMVTKESEGKKPYENTAFMLMLASVPFISVTYLAITNALLPINSIAADISFMLGICPIAVLILTVAATVTVGTVSMATKTHKADVSRTVRLGIVSIAAFVVISGSLSSTAISVTETSVLPKDVAFFMEMASLSESEKSVLEDYRNMDLNDFAEYIDGEIDALADIPPTRLDMIRAQDKEILKAGFGASGLGNVAEAFMLIPICHVIAVAAAGLFLMFSAYTFATGKGSQRLYFILRIVTFAASLITFTIIALFFFATLIKISVALASIGSERMYLVIMNGGPLWMLIFSIVMFAIPTRPTRPKKRRTYPVYAYPQMPYPYPYPYPAQVPPQYVPPTEQDKQNDT